VVHVSRAASDELVLPGEVQAYVNAPIYARTSGYVKHWDVDIGAQVRKGQLLAELDTPEVDAQYVQAKADLATAEANYQLAVITEKRTAQLSAIQAASQQDEDDRLGDLQAKKAIVQSARANLAHFEELQGFKRVVAPFDGLITARHVDIGNLVQNGTGTAGGAVALFDIADANRLRVYVDVPEYAARRITDGLGADLSFSENPGQTFSGRVVRSAQAINPVSRTLHVEVDVDNPSAALYSGAYSQVHFHLPADSRLILPVNTLLFRADGLRVATLADDHTIKLVNVTLGRDLGSKVEVVNGLTGQEAVVINPPDSIADGAAVRLVAEPAPGGGK
jgi:RND family efflux transporter MFP subunit